MSQAPFTIADWQRLYQGGDVHPRDVLPALAARFDARDPAWIHRCDAAFIAAQVERLDHLDRTRSPLWGVPFAVKDNIAVGGLPTTAACPAFAHVADESATVVQRLMDAGAVLLGKTNLDQFATGLVGTRSPYGAVPNTFVPAHVSGGSSSGSASVVARGLVPFALGTDTAGSGRVPAGFNNLVGLKATPGRIPMQGVLPACRTLDVVSIFALTVADAAQVMAVIEGTDAEAVFQAHPLQRAWLAGTGRTIRVGVPADDGCDPSLGFDRAWADAMAAAGALGVQVAPIDMGPFAQVARLLYEGPWVAERYTVVHQLLESHPEALDPVVRGVISAARRFDAADAFRARYDLEDLRHRIAPVWDAVDVLMVPTAPTCPTLEAVAAEPVLRNSELGRFTNFVNLLGLSAIAVPAGFGSTGLPFGVTFVGPPGADAALVDLANRWQAARAMPLGCRLRDAMPADHVAAAMPAAAPSMLVAVVGAHLRGMPLHHQLVERQSRLVAATTTAPCYRLYALAGTVPPKPGLVRVSEGGVAIELEVYEMPQAAMGSFLAGVAAPLAIGTVLLADGRQVPGFVCEPAGLEGAEDISAKGGWRAHVASGAP